MRPHDIELGDPGTAPLAGKVVAVRRFGQSHRVDLAVDISGETTIVEAAVANGQNPRVGEEIGIQPTRYRVFAA
jgi:sulfate transport system ATP-binding protein